MVWDEWEQLKAAAVERQPAHMQLSSYLSDSGGSGTAATGALRSDKSTWSKSGADVGDLRDNADKALVALTEAQVGTGNDAGCLTSTAQQGVYESWDRRVKDISALCAGLSDVLRKTGNDLLRTDQDISAEITKLNQVGASGADGSGKGR